MAGLAEHHQSVRILGVVVVELPPRGEGVIHAVADGMAQLGLVHPTVQRQSGDQVHVVDPCLRRQVEHRLDHALADVRPAHRGQG